MPSNTEVIRAINAITDAVTIINISDVNLHRFNTILENIDEFNNNKRMDDNQQAKESLKDVIKQLLELLTDPLTALYSNCYGINRIVRIIRDLEAVDDNTIDSMRYCKRFDSLVSRNFSLSDSMSAKLEYLRYCNLYNNWNDVEISRLDAFNGFNMSNTILDDSNERIDRDDGERDDGERDDEDLNPRIPIEYSFGDRRQQSNSIQYPNIPFNSRSELPPTFDNTNNNEPLVEQSSIVANNSSSFSIPPIRSPVREIINTSTNSSNLNGGSDSNLIPGLSDPDPINSFIAFTNTLNNLLELNGMRRLQWSTQPISNNISSLLEPVKLVQSDIDLFHKNGTQCAICIDNFSINESVIYLPCFHVFHEGCITNALTNTTKCPLCNVDVVQLLRQ